MARRKRTRANFDAGGWADRIDLALFLVAVCAFVAFDAFIKR